MLKAERVNRVDNSLWSKNELLRRLPEIEAIHDEEVRAATIRTFMDGCPDYFWRKPTSSTGKYHSDDECGIYGNWLHSKRVFAEYCNISESYVESDVMTERRRECGKAAALLHDMLKYGWPSDREEHTVGNHDIIGAQVARHIGECPDEIPRLIVTHNGPWADGPLPANEREWLFHTADKSASGVHEDVRAIYRPAEELAQEWPNVPVIDDLDNV